MNDITPAHDQKITHNYLIHYPEHFPRESDPHYVDFNHFRNSTKATARCSEGKRHDFPNDPPPQLGKNGYLSGQGEIRAECDLDHPLELHHAIIEFSLQNGIDLAMLEKDYPGVSNPNEVGAWVESATNLEFLCIWHHRAHGGKHTVAYADYEAARYVRGLLK